ncbi:DNA-processing protein DprA [Pararhodonellum marinum]|uniref:DNA-processing protein DprA n=1 Tax=Pararhodonellum marinum TaxID=2755358 RepID=UPI00188E2986|nr:DNA-processing protein DprA [Pararhodonellum marinum]
MDQTINETFLYRLALSLGHKIGPGVYKNIISYSGSAEGFFKLPAGKAAKIPGIGEKLLSIRKQKDQLLRDAEKLALDCQKKGIHIFSYLDPGYPERLKPIEDAPVILYSKGNVDFNAFRTIGIVGTRNATEYGKAITQKIVEDLLPYQPLVISGLAYGIDIEAHRSSLKHHMSTIGVLGSPLDKIYPAAHKSTSESMMENGGIVSEFRLGAEMVPGNFPQRNRIIAGLSDALIVVEAAKRGGALITAEIAYSYNKEVLAVPGNLQSIYSEGCNNLIRSMKAAIYTGPKDLEDSLSWSKDTINAQQPPQKVRDYSTLDEEEAKIMALMEGNEELDIDRISWQTQIPIYLLASKLLNLEFQGFVKSLPGKRYKVS